MEIPRRGKKACSALDLDYDGDEIYDDNYFLTDEVVEESAHNKSSSQKSTHHVSKSRTIGSSIAINDNGIGPQNRYNTRSIAVVKPNKQMVSSISTERDTKQHQIYISNPSRRPLFTEYIATHNDGLLIHVVSFLHITDVARLSMVSKVLDESLSVDGLYCRGDLCASNKEHGILLPCLWSKSNRLLPLLPTNTDDKLQNRPYRISRRFAYECLAFSKSCQREWEAIGYTTSEEERRLRIQSQSKLTFTPRTILSMNTPDEVNTISFSSLQWEESYFAAAAAGYHKRPIQKLRKRIGIRLSYVVSETNNCALITKWVAFDSKGEITMTNEKQYTNVRYLPDNIEKIIQSSIHSESSRCVILASPLQSYSKSYIISMVALPTCPPGTKQRDSNQPLLQTNKHKLIWQKDLPSDWQLFSSSDTSPIISFCKQGRHVIFGSTERWGVLDSESGTQLWSLFGSTGIDKQCSFNMKPLQSALPSEKHQCHLLETTPTINAYLVHHEFIFVLIENGTLMRVYDTSNDASVEPVAEGRLTWSSIMTQKQKRSLGPSPPHHCNHTHEEQREFDSKEFNMSFCSGRIWITGMYNSDLLCSSPSRLLRRLRSRLPDRGSILALQFVRIKSDLQINTPHTIHTWNDAQLYVADATRIHCWRSINNIKHNGTNSSGNHQIKTVLDTGHENNYIESMYVDGTKMIVCTNTTFNNTTTRSWGGSGSILVIPIDMAEARGSVSPPPHSPIMFVHHKKILSVKNFPGVSIYNNGNNNNDRIPRYPISSSSNSNYQLVNTVRSDGRYVLVRGRKGLSKKTIILDLYNTE